MIGQADMAPGNQLSNFHLFKDYKNGKSKGRSELKKKKRY